MTRLSYSLPHGLQETSFIILQDFSKSSAGFCCRPWKILAIITLYECTRPCPRYWKILGPQLRDNKKKKYPIKRLGISRNVSMTSINSCHQQVECHLVVRPSWEVRSITFLPTLLSTGIMCKSLSKAKKKLDTVWAWTPYKKIILLILFWIFQTVHYFFVSL